MSKKILIVEDERTLLKALDIKLSKDGYQVQKAVNGKQGLEMFRKEHPDLILLDIIMPEMDGLIMLKKLRKDKKGKNVPVIVITNLSDDEKESELAKNGVSDYLIKSDCAIEYIAQKVKDKLGD